jgi:hypothetical protein
MTSISTGLPSFNQPPSASNAPLGVYGSVATTGLSVLTLASSNASEEQKIYAIRDQVGLAVADFYTFGLASTAYSLLNRYAPGLMKGLQKVANMLDPVTKFVAGLFDTDRWKTEGNRMKELLKNGVEIPEALRGAMSLTRGRTKEELLDRTVPADFVGITPGGQWANNPFSQSRNEADLRAEDIWGSAAFFEKFGNDWLGSMNESQRRAVADAALGLGAVRERTGTIDITWTPALESEVARIRSATATAP